MTRVCGSNETAAGHGCTNLVSDNGDHCAAGYKSVPPNPNCEHEDKTSCFCESVLTGKPWSPETEEFATSPTRTTADPGGVVSSAGGQVRRR